YRGDRLACLHDGAREVRGARWQAGRGEERRRVCAAREVAAGRAERQVADSLMRWDREVDVLVFGAGMGGMSAALIASLEGLDVLLCEKTDQVGGTTSTSAGTVWIPGSSQAIRDGVPDKIDEARRFLQAEIGARAEAVREAFLAAGPAALDYLEARTEVKFIAPPMHPDYHSNQPGRALAGRALAPLPFDGRLL